METVCVRVCVSAGLESLQLFFVSTTVDQSRPPPRRTPDPGSADVVSGVLNPGPSVQGDSWDRRPVKKGRRGTGDVVLPFSTTRSPGP